MHKFLIIFFIFIFFQNSDAQTANRCFNLFVKSETGSVEYFAEFIDSLNQRSNQILFKNKMSEHVNSDLANLAFSDRMTASYRAFKIRRILKELKNSEHMDTYDFENLALKLERLTFLIDPTVMLLMNSSEQKIYKQAQHSILAKGLENFLFEWNHYKMNCLYNHN